MNMLLSSGLEVSDTVGTEGQPALCVLEMRKMMKILVGVWKRNSEFVIMYVLLVNKQYAQ